MSQLTFYTHPDPSNEPDASLEGHRWAHGTGKEMPMVKFDSNSRTRVLRRAFLICCLFGIGLAPSARADSFPYQGMFANSNSNAWASPYVSFSFSTPKLLGIRPSEIKVLAASGQDFGWPSDLQQGTYQFDFSQVEGHVVGGRDIFKHKGWVLSETPEPATLTLLGAGLLCAVFLWRRKALA